MRENYSTFDGQPRNLAFAYDYVTPESLELYQELNEISMEIERCRALQ